MLSIIVVFMILLDIYCFLFWVGRWYLLSTRALYWPLLLLFSSCLIVECSKRAVIFNSTVILANLRHTGSSGWANASSLDWIFSFMSWCLEVPAWTSFLFMFSFPFLILSYYFFSRWRSHYPRIRWARCWSSSSRGRPPTTSTTASCRYSSSSYSPSGWLRHFSSCRCWCWRSRCSSSNHPRKRVKMVRYQFVSPRYQFDSSSSTKERKKEWNFPKVL